MDEKIKEINSEKGLKEWFMINYRKIGYSKIIKKDSGDFPDFIMLKNGKKVRVELETLTSNFLLHNHNIKKVDEIVCIKKDISLPLSIIEIKELKYVPKIIRTTFTVDPKTVELINEILKKSGHKYRNKSHLIEQAVI